MRGLEFASILLIRRRCGGVLVGLAISVISYERSVMGKVLVRIVPVR